MTNEELAVRIQRGETQYIAQLWAQTEWLIRQKAYRFYIQYAETCRSAGVVLDDLCQEGYFALVDAIKAFKPDGGYMFNTYLNLPLKTRFNALVGFRGKPRLQTVSMDKEIGEDIRICDMLEDESAAAGFEDVEHRDYLRRLSADMEKALGEIKPDQAEAIKKRYYDRKKLEHGEENAVLRGFRRLERSKTLLQYRDERIASMALRRGSEWYSSTERAAIDIITQEERQTQKRVKNV